ncbi:RidA family protein [Mycolicibacterium frederiksbergense]|uniref:RidA family protein n=1 Tax=Mycolicibacterium frederiksbergense TaxID=117567 RepID=UPI00265BC5BC|nr:RidA family protein [Mycolicibacterium frederiksbergense]MDO0972718.1 RidA family protein [Mycolicibacterium frederiksbergense]
MSTDWAAPAPQGDYVPAVCHDGVIYTAGMTPRRAGALVWTGVVGDTLTAEQARSAAGLAALNALSAARAVMPAHGALRCLRMTVFIACAPGFTALSAVADGASAVLAAELGGAALPARSAIGVRALPSGAPVEVELTAAVR